MIYLTLFYEFLKIGLFTIGGGYAMIPLIEQATVGNGWITSETLLNMIAISESTPGPFAINMATFIGYNQAGVGGAICANIGVVLPSFLIILIIAKIISKVNMESIYVKGVMQGVTPIVVGLITVAFFNAFLKNCFGYIDYNKELTGQIDIVGIVIVVVMGLVLALRKKTSVITIILGSGLLGMLGYYIESIV